MYEIEVCYKIIFEAMLEKPVLKSIAEKINEPKLFTEQYLKR